MGRMFQTWTIARFSIVIGLKVVDDPNQVTKTQIKGLFKGLNLLKHYDVQYF